MTRNLLPGLTALVFAVGCISAEAKLSDTDSTAPVSTIVASYYADDGHVTVAATGLAVILLGGLALAGSALRLREAWQAGRPEGWRAELMEFLEDDLANFVAVMQGAPSQPQRARPLSSVSQKGRLLRKQRGGARTPSDALKAPLKTHF